MSKRSTVAVAFAFTGLAITGCSNSGSGAPQTTTRVEAVSTTAMASIDVTRVKIWVRNNGYSLVASAIHSDCSSGKTKCPGMPVVAAKDITDFDDIYAEYAEKCARAISRTRFRLDMVHRVRPMVTGLNPDQVIAEVDAQKRTATATIKQADGSTVVMHFDFAEGAIRPECHSDGTAMIEKQ